MSYYGFNAAFTKWKQNQLHYLSQSISKKKNTQVSLNILKSLTILILWWGFCESLSRSRQQISSHLEVLQVMCNQEAVLLALCICKSSVKLLYILLWLYDTSSEDWQRALDSITFWYIMVHYISVSFTQETFSLRFQYTLSIAYHFCFITFLKALPESMQLNHAAYKDKLTDQILSMPSQKALQEQVTHMRTRCR